MKEAPDPPTPTDGSRESSDERPPLGTWRRMYALVLGALVLEVLLFYLFTRIFE